MGRVREEKRIEENRREEETRSEKRKSQKKEDAGARKGRKVATQCFSNGLWLRGSKSRHAKAAGAKPSGQMRDEKSARCCGAKHTSKSKCTKHTILGQSRATLGS